MPPAFPQDARPFNKAVCRMPSFTHIHIVSLIATFFVATPSMATSQTLIAVPNEQHVATYAISEPVTLAFALEMALNRNPDLLAARQEVSAIDASVLQAGVRLNPEIAASIEDLRKETRTSTIQLNQTLELGGKRAARISAAERGRDAALTDLAAKRAEVRGIVIAAFFELLAAQERVRLAQSAVELAQRATVVASKRVLAGKVSPVEETKAKVAEANVRLELNQAKSDLLVARQRLSATWGDPLPTFQEASGDLNILPALPDATILANRLTNSPTVKRAQVEIERRMALAELEKTRRVPNLTVSAGIKRAEDIGRNQAVFGVSIPLPLFDRNQGNLLEALRRTDKARDELTATQVRLNSDFSQAYAQLVAARQAIAALQEEILPGAQSAYDAATKGFEFGKFNFLEVLDAQRTLLQARTQYLKALSDVHRYAADIERILGDGLPATQAAKP